jgi:protein O-mannosyl-transferase
MGFEPSTPPYGARGVAVCRAAGIGLLLFGVTFAAYVPALAGAMQWDDSAHITAPALQSLKGLWRIWFRLGTTQQYYPVLHSAFWLEHRLWGDSVLGYHAANVALHAASACLFALLLARVRPGGDGRIGAGEWFAAFLFALHPICVESVAWISEQKNTLSLFLYLLSALVYLRFDRERRWVWYGAALGLFILALLAKSVTATLPGALLLALAWQRGSLGWRRDVAPVAPWFVIGACAGLFTAWVERNFIGAKGQAFDLGFLERCFLAGRVVWFYLGKLVWPSDLTFIYPRWEVGYGWPWPLWSLCLVAAAGLLYCVRRWSRAPLLALLFFVGSLFPALGFFNVYPFLFSYVADHWQYLPSLGVIALAGEGAAAAGRRWLLGLGGRERAGARGALAAGGTAVLALLFALTWRQSGLYRDVPTLYADTLAKNPGCWMAHNNLGVYLNDAGMREAALTHLREAVRLKPDYSDAHNNLGDALSKGPGGEDEAIREFETALRIEPGMIQAHANLGLILVNRPGRISEGVAHLEEALRGNEGDPHYAGLHVGLGVAFAKMPGRLPDAIAQFEEALRLKPGAVDVLDGLGVALSRAGRPEDAVARFREALRLSPNNPAVHNNLGNVLSQMGRGPEAVLEYRAALRAKPDFAEAHVNLGRSLRSVGDGAEAIEEYREALGLMADSAEVRNSLGSLLLLQGKVGEALEQFGDAVRLEPGSAPYRNNLGIALTRSGRTGEAIEQLRKALELAPGFSDAHYNLGVALLQAGLASEAAAEFSASGRTPP